MALNLPRSDAVNRFLDRLAPRFLGVLLAAPFVVGTAAAAVPFVVLQSGFCATPFLGDIATWATPKATALLMLVGAAVVAYGILGAPAEGRGPISLRVAVIGGLALVFLGFQWEPFWMYVGSDIFGGPTDGGQMNALTCGM